MDEKRTYILQTAEVVVKAPDSVQTTTTVERETDTALKIILGGRIMSMTEAARQIRKLIELSASTLQTTGRHPCRAVSLYGKRVWK